LLKNSLPIIYLAVTNDLNFDQRMMRICDTLSRAGYEVVLIGRRKKNSVPLEKRNYSQHRINCWFERGKRFYAEYNIRLFFYLLFKKMDCICAIDLDTILPCYYISKLKKIERVVDSHEYFSQQKEIVTRANIYRFWYGIEKRYLPRFTYGYTVSESIGQAFKKKYNIDHIVIRNLPMPVRPATLQQDTGRKMILYQGAINEGRGLEFLIPAMAYVAAELHVFGDGNFLVQAKEIILSNNLQSKVFIHQPVLPEALHMITSKAYIGVNLVENIGLNQYYSLANKFFDFIQHEIPQVTMNFPEYKRINDAFGVAILIDDLEETSIAHGLNVLLQDQQVYNRLKENCRKAKHELTWESEEKKLIAFYKNIVG
jgi:glycosyltransferase involved in cell wall biosynthesis